MDTMADDKFPHVWIANYIADALYVEEALSKNLDVSVNGTRMQIPSVTSQVITPESATKPVIGGDNDYIVYGLERDDRPDEPYKKHKTMSLYVYTNKQKSGLKINDIIMEYMGDSDAACRDLKMYQEENGGGRYKFLSIEYKLLNGPQPLNLGTEGGLFGSLILIQFSYSYPMNQSGISR